MAFVDVAGGRPNLPVSPARSSCITLHEAQGIDRIDLRWGFDADALMSVTRLVAPKPWKSLLAVL